MESNLTRSASSRRYQWRYDVFLNFTGADTRNIFVSHLYDALRRRRLSVFKDDKTLRMGRNVPSSLFKAIEDSRISIAVLSENYAKSKPCLEELVKMIECRRSMGRIVYPVFYHVEPRIVGEQSGCFKTALAVHGNHTKRGVWKEALTEAAKIAGLHVHGHKDESECVNEIVEKVLTELGPRMLGLASMLHNTTVWWCLLSCLKFNDQTEPDDAIMDVRGGPHESIRTGRLNQRVVAIQRINVLPGSESDLEFWNEVSIRSSMKHDNVARLFGYCIKDGACFLVEEHATNGTLHQVLHCEGGAQPQGFVLAFLQRFTIAYDVAKGLEYLHGQNRLGHVDSTNVLLVEKFGAKISTGGPGTRSYRAPECNEGQLTKEGDVYSFGVLLLELLTGTKPSEGMVESVTPRLTRSIESCIDPKLNGKYDLHEAKKLAWAISMTTMDEPRARPAMEAVVEYLKGVIEKRNGTNGDN